MGREDEGRPARRSRTSCRSSQPHSRSRSLTLRECSVCQLSRNSLWSSSSCTARQVSVSWTSVKSENCAQQSAWGDTVPGDSSNSSLWLRIILIKYLNLPDDCIASYGWGMGLGLGGTIHYGPFMHCIPFYGFFLGLLGACDTHRHCVVCAVQRCCSLVH